MASGIIDFATLAIPNHVETIEFTTGGLQLGWRNISSCISDNTMYLSSLFGVISNDVHTCVVYILIFNKFAQISKNLFSTIAE